MTESPLASVEIENRTPDQIAAGTPNGMTLEQVTDALAVDCPDMKDRDERFSTAFGCQTGIILGGKLCIYRHDYERTVRLIRDRKPTYFD
jgi:hypothetical protein